MFEKFHFLRRMIKKLFGRIQLPPEISLVKESIVLVANAGDSRCALSRKGQAHDLTKDQKITSLTSRAIGDMEFKENEHLSVEKQMVTTDPELNSVELCYDDKFFRNSL
ncbi:hypothetical protein K1719_009779 [Acacia pycnantha]|nr:hypothetical protein K1719_009779 [Acacia pycnantha]